MHIVQSLWLDVAIGMIQFELFEIKNPTQWDCILIFCRKSQKVGRQDGAEVTRRCGHGRWRCLILSPRGFVCGIELMSMLTLIYIVLLFWNLIFQMADDGHSKICCTAAESIGQTKIFKPAAVNHPAIVLRV